MRCPFLPARPSSATAVSCHCHFCSCCCCCCAAISSATAGGITPSNAGAFLAAGASHVIVTSYVFREGRIDWGRLGEMAAAVGRERLVLDLSCRKRRRTVAAPAADGDAADAAESSAAAAVAAAAAPGFAVHGSGSSATPSAEGAAEPLSAAASPSRGAAAPSAAASAAGFEYVVVTDRWQRFTDCVVSPETLATLAAHCAEFLVHGVDVEGLRAGIEVRVDSAC